MTINKKKRGYLSFILSLSIGITGCTKITTKNNVKEEVKVKEVEEEKVLASVKTSYIEDDILSYKTTLEFEHDNEIVFQNKYSDMEGIFTFRGNSLRNSPSFGYADLNDKELEILWEFRTASSSWGGGAGWTGQPAIVKWPKELRESMNIYDEFKGKEDFTEVIYGSLDGNIYFLELNSGKTTRDKIKVGNPIKGSLSIDPRGIPLLYVGEGINESGVVGGENGLLYNIKLNTTYDKNNNTISIDPKINRYNFSSSFSRGRIGIENSVATYANLAYFADNGGVIQCVDLNNLKPVWSINGFDDIDATLTIDIENDKPYVYCGNEVDHQGTRGVSKIKKIDGLTGEVIWEKEFECESLIGKSAVNGGLMATNVVGKNNIDNMAIFSLARYNGFNKGGMFALNKENGEIIWEKLFDNYMWSSPVDIYDKDGNGYIIQGDSAGYLHLIDGKEGNIKSSVLLNGNIESSPAVFNNVLVVATRNGTIYGVKVK